jgi:tetratricopeptide (TPR) repeat protein
MKSLLKSKKVVILLLIIIIVITVPTSVFVYKNYNFNKLYNSGIELLSKEDFDRAISAFNDSLRYKPNQKEVVKSKIILAKDIKDSKGAYDSAVTMENGQKYLEAIDAFNKVKNTDAKRYTDALNKIKECSDFYIKENIDNAKNAASNKNFNKAIDYIDIILKFDNSNKNAKTLKNEYNNNIEQMVAQTKTTEEDRLATKQAKNSAKIKQSNPSTSINSSSSTTTSTTSSSSSSNGGVTYTYLNSDKDKKSILKINDNGKEVMVSFTRNETYPREFWYSVWQFGADSELPYTIKITCSGVTHAFSRITDRSNTNSDVFQNASGDKILTGTVEILVQYKGKIYPINTSF